MDSRFNLVKVDDNVYIQLQQINTIRKHDKGVDIRREGGFLVYCSPYPIEIILNNYNRALKGLGVSFNDD